MFKTLQCSECGGGQGGELRAGICPVCYGKKRQSEFLSDQFSTAYAEPDESGLAGGDDSGAGSGGEDIAPRDPDPYATWDPGPHHSTIAEDVAPSKPDPYATWEPDSHHSTVAEDIAPCGPDLYATVSCYGGIEAVTDYSGTKIVPYPAPAWDDETKQGFAPSSCDTVTTSYRDEGLPTTECVTALIPGPRPAGDPRGETLPGTDQVSTAAMLSTIAGFPGDGPDRRFAEAVHEQRATFDYATKFDSANGSNPHGPADIPSTLAYATRDPDPNGSTLAHHAGSPTRSFDFATKLPDPDRSTYPSITADPPRKSWPTPPGFEILGELGRGGMGVVYKARHTRLNRIVALKMIKGEGHPGLVERFRIEGESLARLNHPNVMQIFEVGEFNGQPYFSLELLEGGSLWDKIDSTPQDPRETAALLAVITRTMQVAHDLKVVHRDLKPQNILFDRHGVPKVTDFGLAKRLDVESGLTVTLEIMGTPHFMAPEQARGENHDVGPPADIYALGAILYVMLTGKPPFQGTNWRETLMMVTEHDPAPPTRINPRIPRDLDTICLRTLAKEPAKRYLSAGELADDLTRYVEGRPILARPTPFWERAAKWVRRRPERAALLGASAAALIGLIGGAAWYGWHVVEKKREAADHLFSLLSTSRQGLADAKSKFKDGELKVAENSLELLGKKLDSQPTATRLDPRFRKTVDDVETTLAEVKTALDHERVAQVFRGEFERFHSLRDQALLEYTSAQFDPQRAGGGPVLVADKARAALNVFTRPGPDGARLLAKERLPEGTSPADRLDVARGCYEMILILADAEKSLSVSPGKDTKALAERALRLLDSGAALAPNIRDRARHELRRDLLLSLKRDADANQETESLKTLEPTLPLDQYLSGLMPFQQGDFNKAAHYFEAARLGEAKNFWARALLAISYFKMGQTNPSRIVLDECVEMQKDYVWLYILRGFVLGQDASDKASAPLDRKNPGYLAAMKDFNFAEGLMKDLPGDAPEWYLLRVNRGVVKQLYGQLDEAVLDFEEAIRIARLRPLAYEDLAAVYAKRGNHDGAIDKLSEALERTDDPVRKGQVRRKRAKSHSLKAFNTTDAAEVQLALKDYAAARALTAGTKQEIAADLLDQAKLLWMQAESSRESEPEAALKSYGDAAKALEKILGADPESAKARAALNSVMERWIGLLSDRGRVPEAIGHLSEAIASCDKVIGRGGAPSGVYRSRGIAKRMLAQLEREQRLLREDRGSLDSAPQREREKRLFGEALGDLDSAIGLKADQPDLLILRGWARLLQAKSPELARADFHEAIKLAPDSSEAYAGRGSALAALNQIDAAMRDAEQAQRVGGKLSPTTLVACAWIYGTAFQGKIDRQDAAEGVAIKVLGNPVLAADLRNHARSLLRSALRPLSLPQRKAIYDGYIKNRAAFRGIADDFSIQSLLADPVAK